jgi:nitronate monooxygenase
MRRALARRRIAAMSTSTRFTDLAGCRLPLQLAPAAGAVNVPLALAVTGAGGHVMYPVVFFDPDAIDALCDTLDAHTRAYGVNLIAPFAEPECLERAAERAPMVDMFLGDPDPATVERIHAGGALAAWQVGSAEEARAAQDAGCDVIVAQGCEAGGRVRGSIGLLPLLDAVLDAVDVPVVASGGLAGPRSVAAALAAGADAVRCGTAFIATQEASAHEMWKQAVIDARAEDTVVTRAFARGVPDFPHRVLRSSLEAAEAFESDEVGATEVAGRMKDILRFEASAPTAEATGAVDAMAQYAGQSAGAVGAVRPAADVVAHLLSRVPVAV